MYLATISLCMEIKNGIIPDRKRDKKLGMGGDPRSQRFELLDITPEKPDLLLDLSVLKCSPLFVFAYKKLRHSQYNLS